MILRVNEEGRKGTVSVLAKASEFVRKRDVAGLVSIYTEDAIVLAPNMDMIRGGKAIKEFWEAGFNVLGYKDCEFTTAEVVGTGETITEWGRYFLKAQPKGQKAIEDRGKYITLWKRTPKGWKIHWDIFNSSLPPPKEGSA